MKKLILMVIMLLTPSLLGGCLSSKPAPAVEPPAEEASDPLTEARKKLFNELGLQEEGAAVEKEALLPPVLPNPPELPKTDADWPMGSGN